MLHILAAAALALPGAPTAPATAAVAPSGDAELAALGERAVAQLVAYVMRGEGGSIVELAHPAFRVVLPVGIVENRGAVATTADNIQLTRFDQQVLEVRRVGDTAIVLTRVDAEGTVARMAFPGRILMSHVFTRVDGEWRLVHRQMTEIAVPDPVFERALATAIAPLPE